MNVPFRIRPQTSSDEDQDKLTAEFLIGAHARNMVGLRTLTPFGLGDYMRASLYNSVSVGDAAELAAYMEEFRRAHN